VACCFGGGGVIVRLFLLRSNNVLILFFNKLNDTFNPESFIEFNILPGLLYSRGLDRGLPRGFDNN
jgi:hypothetical protein